MAFGLGARDVRMMRTYAAALANYENIKPNRRGDRCISSNKGLTIEKIHNDAIACKYNRNAVVLYHTDGRIELDSCGWTTPSTAVFIYRCTGMQALVRNNTLYVHLQSGYFVVERGLIVKDGVPLNPTQETKEVLNRERAKIARAPLAPFYEHIEAVLAAITPTPELVKQHQKEAGWRNLRDVVNSALGFDDFAPATSYFIAQAFMTGRRSWNRVVGDDYKAGLKRLTSQLNEYLYAEENCYDDVDIPLGTRKGRK